MGGSSGAGSLMSVALLALYGLSMVTADTEFLGLKPRIIGGSNAPSGKFSFIVHLFKDGNPYCGGTLIDAQWVVTAAHCVASRQGESAGAGSFTTDDPSIFKVGYGTTDGGLDNSVDVESITVSGGFDPIWYTSDIALLKIKSNSDLVSKTSIIPISNAQIGANQELVTAGWGQTSNSNSNQANQLKMADLKTASDAECAKGATDWNGQNGRYVCTSFSTAPDIGTCFGDSGGPLLLSTDNGFTLIGLVSFDVNTEDHTNTKCAQEGNVSYFTRVSSYLGFISSTTGISDSVLVGNGSHLSHSDKSSSSSEADTATTNEAKDNTSSSTTDAGSDKPSSTSDNGNKSSDGASTDRSSTDGSSTDGKPTDTHSEDHATSGKETSGAATDTSSDSHKSSSSSSDHAGDVSQEEDNTDTTSGAFSKFMIHTAGSGIMLAVSMIATLF